MTKPISISSPEDMLALGRQLACVLCTGDVITLSGSLGAGKTTLARGIISGLGFADEIPSPTFPILQYYDPPELAIPLVHADFYRLSSRDDLDELGIETGGSSPVLIAEWAENVGGFSGPQTLQLRIGFGDASARSIDAEAGADWTERWRAMTEFANGQK
jgi:tRNA threonylcarbamoyladenosine biosynthesis protein TsaE